MPTSTAGTNSGGSSAGQASGGTGTTGGTGGASAQAGSGGMAGSGGKPPTCDAADYLTKVPREASGAGTTWTAQLNVFKGASVNRIGMIFRCTIASCTGVDPVYFAGSTGADARTSDGWEWMQQNVAVCQTPDRSDCAQYLKGDWIHGECSNGPAEGCVYQCIGTAAECRSGKRVKVGAGNGWKLETALKHICP